LRRLVYRRGLVVDKKRADARAQGTRLRHDCLTNQLGCKKCGEGTILTVDLLGRLVTIADDTLFLSACCGTFLYYGGTGHEFAPACGPQCAASHHLYRKRERPPAVVHASSSASSSSASSLLLRLPSTTTTTSPSPHQPLRACFICEHRHGAQQVLRLLDLRTRAVVPHVLCPKHVVPQHILHHVLETNDLLRYFQQRQRSAAAAALLLLPSPSSAAASASAGVGVARARKRPRLVKRRN
jgi:hypothetical protein